MTDQSPTDQSPTLQSPTVRHPHPIWWATLSVLVALGACSADQREGGGDLDSVADGAGVGVGDAAVDVDADASDGAGATDGSDSAGATDDSGGDGKGAADSKTNPGRGEPCKSDKDCIAFDLICDKAGGVCVACNTDADCLNGGACKGHQCVAAAKSCASSKDCADLGQICDKAAGACVDCIAAEDCSDGKVCDDTVCVNPICADGETRCKDPKTLEVCAAGGLSWNPASCPSAQVCADNACISALCTPGAHVCEGAAVKTCATSGESWSAPKACKSGETCAAGVCIAATCSEGALSCADTNTLLICSASVWKSSKCAAGLTCVNEQAGSHCVKTDCIPGSYVCFGDKIAECNASGQIGDLSGDCAAEGKVCKVGVCVVVTPDAICTAGASKCEGDSVATCKADGSAWTLAACVPPKVCKAAVCVAKDAGVSCAAGAKSCDGVTPLVCNAKGDGWDKQANCDDGYICTTDTCVNGGCDAVPAADGLDCGGVAGAGGGCGASACLAGQCVKSAAAPFWLKTLDTKGGTLRTIATHAAGFHALIHRQDRMVRRSFDDDGAALEEAQTDIGSFIHNPLYRRQEAIWPAGNFVVGITGQSISSLSFYGKDAKQTGSYVPAKQWWLWDAEPLPNGDLAMIYRQSNDAKPDVVVSRITAAGVVVGSVVISGLSGTVQNGRVVQTVDGGLIGAYDAGIARKLNAAASPVSTQVIVFTHCQLLGPWPGVGDIAACTTFGKPPYTLQTIDGFNGKLTTFAVPDAKLTFQGERALAMGDELWLSHYEYVASTFVRRIVRLRKSGVMSLSAAQLESPKLPKTTLVASGKGAILFDVNGDAGQAMRVDAFGHGSCATSGVCATKSLSDCDDGSACKLPGCDAVAGCSFANVPDGSSCGDGKSCQAGLCK